MDNRLHVKKDIAAKYQSIHNKLKITKTTCTFLVRGREKEKGGRKATKKKGRVKEEF